MQDICLTGRKITLLDEELSETAYDTPEGLSTNAAPCDALKTLGSDCRRSAVKATLLTLAGCNQLSVFIFWGGGDAIFQIVFVV